MDMSIKIALMICFVLAKGKNLQEFIEKAKKVTVKGHVKFVIDVLFREGVIWKAGDDERLQLVKHPSDIYLADVAGLFSQYIGLWVVPTPAVTTSGKPSVDFMLTPLLDEAGMKFAELTLQDAIDRKRD